MRTKRVRHPRINVDCLHDEIRRRCVPDDRVNVQFSENTSDQTTGRGGGGQQALDAQLNSVIGSRTLIIALVNIRSGVTPVTRFPRLSLIVSPLSRQPGVSFYPRPALVCGWPLDWREEAVYPRPVCSPVSDILDNAWIIARIFLYLSLSLSLLMLIKLYLIRVQNRNIE